MSVDIGGPELADVGWREEPRNYYVVTKRLAVISLVYYISIFIVHTE